jgi:hypothetical protein
MLKRESFPSVILSEAKNLNACRREMLRLRFSMTGGGGVRLKFHRLPPEILTSRSFNAIMSTFLVIVVQFPVWETGRVS